MREATVGAAPMVVVPDDAAGWLGARLPGASLASQLGLSAGGFALLRPPEQATEERVEEIRAALESGGVRVRVEAPRKSSPVGKGEARERRAGEPHRAVVMRLVEESRSADKDALREVVVELLDEAGV